MLLLLFIKEGDKMPDLEHNEVVKIANLYGIDPNFIEKFGRVYKIYSKSGEFALKRVEAQVGIDFIRYVQMLYQRGYNRIVPIFPTLDGRFAVLEGNTLFYLMPWLLNQERENKLEKHHELFRELARLHSITAREVTVTEEERKEHYDITTARWEKEQEILEQFIERCEKQWYMSPFQLLFCMYYQEITMGQSFAMRKLKEWHELTKEETKARSVIVHGKISPEHFLYNEKGVGFFTNFEQAGVASPIQDLLPFLARSMNTQPKRFDDSVHWLGTYFRHFPFKHDEMLLFLSYLAHPGPIYRVAEAYFTAGKDKNEMKFVRQLQRQYWYMKNTEFVVMKLEEKEQSKQELNANPPSS